MDIKLDFLSDFFNNIIDYFKGLSANEMYAWIAITVGLILIVTAIILW